MKTQREQFFYTAGALEIAPSNLNIPLNTYISTGDIFNTDAHIMESHIPIKIAILVLVKGLQINLSGSQKWPVYATAAVLPSTF